MLSEQENEALKILPLESQRVALRNLAASAGDGEHRRVRLLRFNRTLRKHRSELGLDPFTILMLIQLAIKLWQLWKWWSERDQKNAEAFLAQLAEDGE
jgi:hypothetical protein